MRPSLFITGAAGYVGRRLLELAGEDRRIVALVRDVEGLPAELRSREHIDVVEGDLLDPESYSDALDECEQVLHLAAVTGKAPRGDYFRVNVEGTRALLGAADRAGVQGFVFVSSIAVGFEDQTRYWYAHSKGRAEDLVRESGLAHCLVRPTMIVGPNAPVVAGLCQLAAAPVMPVFGAGVVEVQPVFVDDLVRCLLDLLDERRFEGETIEVGGRDVVSIEELMLRLRRACGRPPARVVHLPLRPVRWLLGVLEMPPIPLMPLTAGQLATFANDGTAAPSAWMEGRRDQLRGLDAALEGVGEALETGRQNALLEREGRLLGRYLARREPGRYVISKYLDFHQRRGQRLGVATRFDRWLLALARRVPLGLRAADAYTARFGRTSILRGKLVLMLALLECAPATSAALDEVGMRGRGATIVGLSVRVGLEALLLLITAALLLPAHAASKLLPARRIGATS